MADRSSWTPSQSRLSVHSSDPNVFSDEYALEEDQGDASEVETSLSREHSSSRPQRMSSTQSTADPRSALARRSRLSNRGQIRHSVSSRGDETLTRTGSLAHQSVRSLSSVVPPRAQSPYQGATGPSHPYGMYTQDISITRTPSVTTTSTLRRPERAYSGPGGPTQPYGMYSQNTVPEDDGVNAGVEASIHPGFPGLEQNYRRRLGPDVDDADDLIGPDGYTEQLPPYTRYANGIPPKVDSAALPSEENQPTLQRPAEQISEPSHRASAEHYRPPNSLDGSPGSSSSTSALDSAGSNEKVTLKQRIKKGGTRPVCCGLMPCWLLIFVVIVTSLAVLLGGVIGSLVAHHDAMVKAASSQAHRATHHPTTTQVPAAASTNLPSTTNNPEVDPIPTPTGLPILPTGIYTFTLDNVSYASSSCLPNPDQQTAWDCSTGAVINITVSMDQTNSPTVDINHSGSDNMPLRYGPQAPLLSGPTPLQLSRDKAHPRKGPAYFFSSQVYNKTVILRPSDLPRSPAMGKRSMNEKRGSEWTSSDTVKTGDTPWFCFWNNTYVEGFIYVFANEEAGSTVSSNFASTATSVAVGVASPTPASGGTSSSSPGTAYPKMIRVMERRNVSSTPDSRSVYCQQMRISDTGKPCPLFPSRQYTLSEVEPPSLAIYQADARGQSPTSNPFSPGARLRQMVRRQGQLSGACTCDWMG